MSDENVPTNGQSGAPDASTAADSTPTEALELADQQPVPTSTAATAPAAAPAASHTRTILEVVGGVVAAGMIVVAGAVGFAVGHTTAGPDDGVRLDRAAQPWNGGPDAGAPFGQGDGRQGDRGFGQRDADPHAGGPGREGGQGMGPGQGPGGGPGQGPGGGPGHGDGFGQRGEDPDGDNWTGQGRGQGNGLQDGTGPLTQPTPSSSAG